MTGESLYYERGPTELLPHLHVDTERKRVTEGDRPSAPGPWGGGEVTSAAPGLWMD